MRIAFFGKVSESIGAREIDFSPQAEVATIGELRQSLAKHFPAAATLLVSPRLKAFVADSMVADTAPVNPDARIEFLPPVSGG